MSLESKATGIAIDKISSVIKKLKNKEFTMSEELKVNPNQTADVQEAELAAQNMVDGTEQVPQIDVEQDYEASKEYSVSDIDKSEVGA